MHKNEVDVPTVIKHDTVREYSLGSYVLKVLTNLQTLRPNSTGSHCVNK